MGAVMKLVERIANTDAPRAVILIRLAQSFFQRAFRNSCCRETSVEGGLPKSGFRRRLFQIGHTEIDCQGH